MAGKDRKPIRQNVSGRRFAIALAKSARVAG